MSNANSSRREFLRVVAAGAASAALAGRTSPAGQTGRGKKRPNIVLIYADDVGYGDVSCYGATKISTPHIDRLAREGRMFTDAHSASAVCTPSRYSLLTGQYAWRVNCWGPLPYDRPLIVNTASMTLGRLLKRHGYATACIGKWHLGFGLKGLTDWNGPLKPGPLEIGFDYYFGVPLVNSHAPFVYVENHHVVGLDPDDPFVLRTKNDRRPASPTQRFPEKGGLDRWAGAKRAHTLYRDEMVATTLTEKAVGWMRTHTEKKKKGDPFFLYLATTNIHHPFTPHPRFKGKSRCGRYGDFMLELDWIVGQVLKALDEMKQADNTLVIFTSDNGGMLNEGGRDAWKAGHHMNGRLLGWKFGAWEGGHRVPFIARWPGHVPAHTRSNQLLCSVDMLGTLAALLGDELKKDEGPDSFNLLPALLGNPRKPVRDHAILAPFRKSNLAIRKGKWVYIGDQGSGGFGRPRVGGKAGGPAAVGFAKRTNSDITPGGKIKKNAPRQQLYDLNADVSQETNVINKHPEVARQLRELLKEYQRQGRSAPSP